MIVRNEPLADDVSLTNKGLAWRESLDEKVAGARVGIYPTALTLPPGANRSVGVGHEAAQEATCLRPLGLGEVRFRWGHEGVVDAA